MTPPKRWHKQTTFYDPNDPVNPNKGNCGEAAIASLLGAPNIPEKFGQSGLASDYWDEMEAYARQRGFALYTIEAHVHFEGLYLASGPSIRGCSHMVVMADGALAHDPHPSNAGIKYVERTYLLVPLDPAAHQGKS